MRNNSFSEQPADKTEADVDTQNSSKSGNQAVSKVESRTGISNVGSSTRHLKSELLVLSLIFSGFLAAAIVPFQIEGYISLLGRGDIFALLIMIGLIGTVFTILQRLGLFFSDDFNSGKI